MEWACNIPYVQKIIFVQSLESQGTNHNSFINVGDVCYIRYGSSRMKHFPSNVIVTLHNRNCILVSVKVQFRIENSLLLKIFEFFLRNVWYIFVGEEIPNYGQYPFECTCTWISCTHLWISRSRPFMLNPELESFSAQRHLNRFIHVIKLTNRISDFWDVQGRNSNHASNSIINSNLALIVSNNLFQNVECLQALRVKKINE